MKICILSMQKVNNYGSLLQAYSLKKLIESLGHSVSFIDITPNAEDNQLRDTVVEFAESPKQDSQNILSRILYQDNNLFFAIKKAFSKKLTQKLQLSFERDALQIDISDNNKTYDVCVIGSDEVFNCMNNAPWGFTTQLFGNVKQAPKVITYAASCGFTKIDMLSEKIRNAIIEAFSNISAFSVRDDNTFNFVSSLSELPPQINLDPVVVGNFDHELSTVNVKNKLPKRCCIVYAYHDRINSQDEIQAIQQFCKQHKLTPVTVGGYQRWIHHHLALSPFEVLAAVKQADFVITDTFHGTIFSAKYARRFAVIVRESNRNKLTDLMHRLGIEKHQLGSLDEIEKTYQTTPDRAAIDAVISEERSKTLEYLENNL